MQQEPQKNNTVFSTNDKQQPLVSICIPMYNGSHFIKEALESCLSQTYPHIEILVCDDGSTDDSLAIVSEYANQFPNIILHRNDNNLGLVGNWKKCISAANGKWIKFLFQDDLMMPECVEVMMHACLRDNTKMAICARTFIFENNADERIKAYFTNELSRAEKVFTGKEKFIPEESQNILPPYVIENVLGEPICTLFHQSLYEAVGGYDASFRQIVDYEFSLKAVLTHPFSMVQSSLVQFRVHGESTTGTTHAGSAQKNAVTEKMIRSTVGDFLKLIHVYKTDKRFNCFLTFWGKERLELLERYLYLRACRYTGTKKVRNALQDIIENNDNLNRCRYHLLKYKIIKSKYKKKIKPLMNKPVSV